MRRLPGPSRVVPFAPSPWQAAKVISNAHRRGSRKSDRLVAKLATHRPQESRSKWKVAMVRCPVCESVQMGFVVSPRPTSCYYCGATWLQDGSEQTAVRAAQPREGKFVHSSGP